MHKFEYKYNSFSHKSISVTKYKLLIFDEDIENVKKIKRYFQRYEFFIKTEKQIDLNLCRVIQPDFIIINVSTLTPKKCFLWDGIFNEYRGRYIILTNINNIPECEVIGYLEAGAADVLDKSTRFRLLLAKIRSRLITYNIENSIQNEEENINIGSVHIDKIEGKLIVNNHTLDFSVNEFTLLMMLVERPNKIISRDKLYRVLLNSQYDGVNRSIDNTVFRIRKKLEEEGVTQFKIKSVRGKGYLFLNNEY
jgi:DNA-binding response OmpR family regulator